MTREFYRTVHELAAKADGATPPLITSSFRFVVGSTEEEAKSTEREAYE
ncbi:hypothetical protein [Jiangella endophytica]|nr:hypothetical protein [Jiangella endophytica]